MVAVPGHVTSRIDPRGDTDSYSVHLSAGQSYDFDVVAGHLDYRNCSAVKPGSAELGRLSLNLRDTET